MSGTLPRLMTVGLSLLLVALTACGGDGREETQTPARPATTAAAQAPTGSTQATPTQTAALTPAGREFSASATVTAKVGNETLTFENGTCLKGPDDAWLAVTVGQIASAKYFLLIVGNLTGQEGARSAKGGGVFTDDEIAVLTGGQSGTTFSLRLVEQDKVTVADDLRSGEFVGTAGDGQAVSGSFKC